MNPLDRERFDVAVVGGGAAGCMAALSSSREGANTALIVKGRLRLTGSSAFGRSEAMGVAAALGLEDPEDSPREHFLDTVRMSRGFVDERLVKVLVEEAPKRVMELVELGVEFDSKDGRLRQYHSDLTSHPRVLRSDGATGKAMVDVLSKEVRDEGVHVYEEFMAARLLARDGRVVGLLAVDGGGNPMVVEAGAVVLATGGAGQLYLYNVHTREMTGDGYAMAYEAGAELVNMEFIQMGPAVVHPTKMVLSGKVWRLKPRLYNSLGEEFLERYLPSGLTVEDVMEAKTFPFLTHSEGRFIDVAVYTEMLEGRRVYCDLTERGGELQERMPHTYRHLLNHGVDLRRTPIEICVAAQMWQGGVRIINEWAETTIPHLYAAGETAGGVRGPVRPGGNSLAECLVFGHRAGTSAAKRVKTTVRHGAREEDLRDFEALVRRLERGSKPHGMFKAVVQRVMWEEAFVTRSGEGLRRALETLTRLREEASREMWAEGVSLVEALSTLNLIQVGILSLKAMLMREESRGGHYRVDHPNPDPRMEAAIVLSKRGAYTYRFPQVGW